MPTGQAMTTAGPAPGPGPHQGSGHGYTRSPRGRGELPATADSDLTPHHTDSSDDISEDMDTTPSPRRLTSKAQARAEADEALANAYGPAKYYKGRRSSRAMIVWRNWGFPTLGYMPLVLIQTTLSTILPRHARFPAQT